MGGSALPRLTPKRAPIPIFSISFFSKIFNLIPEDLQFLQTGLESWNWEVHSLNPSQNKRFQIGFGQVLSLFLCLTQIFQNQSHYNFEFFWNHLVCLNICRICSLPAALLLKLHRILCMDYSEFEVKKEKFPQKICFELFLKRKRWLVLIFLQLKFFLFQAR